MKQIENHFNFEKKTWANKKVAELRYSMRNLFNIIRDKLIKEVKKTKMSETAKRLALHNLEELQLVTSIDDPIIKTFHEYDQEDVIDSMKGVCGKDQLSEQAFLSDMFVTFCPGFTLRNLAMSKDNQDFVLSLIFVMASMKLDMQSTSLIFLVTEPFIKIFLCAVAMLSIKIEGIVE